MTFKSLQRSMEATNAGALWTHRAWEPTAFLLCLCKSSCQRWSDRNYRHAHPSPVTISAKPGSTKHWESPGAKSFQFLTAWTSDSPMFGSGRSCTWTATKLPNIRWKSKKSTCSLWTLGYRREHPMPSPGSLDPKDCSGFQQPSLNEYPKFMSILTELCW